MDKPDRTELLALRAQLATQQRSLDSAKRRVDIALGNTPHESRPSHPSSEETGGHRTLTVDLDADRTESDRRAIEQDRRDLDKERQEFAKARLDSIRFDASKRRAKVERMLWHLVIVLIAALSGPIAHKLGLTSPDAPKVPEIRLAPP